MMPAIGETFSQGFSPLDRFMAWLDRLCSIRVSTVHCDRSKTCYATYDVVLS